MARWGRCAWIVWAALGKSGGDAAEHRSMCRIQRWTDSITPTAAAALKAADMTATRKAAVDTRVSDAARVVIMN
jgi:hypothetical protein